MHNEVEGLDDGRLTSRASLVVLLLLAAAVVLVFAILATNALAATSPNDAAPIADRVAPHSATHYGTAEIDGMTMFYGEAGPKDTPVVLLLHGFRTSS